MTRRNSNDRTSTFLNQVASGTIELIDNELLINGEAISGGDGSSLGGTTGSVANTLLMANGTGGLTIAPATGITSPAAGQLSLTSSGFSSIFMEDSQGTCPWEIRAESFLYTGFWNDTLGFHCNLNNTESTLPGYSLNIENFYKDGDSGNGLQEMNLSYRGIGGTPDYRTVSYNVNCVTNESRLEFNLGEVKVGNRALANQNDQALLIQTDDDGTHETTIRGGVVINNTGTTTAPVQTRLTIAGNISGGNALLVNPTTMANDANPALYVLTPTNAFETNAAKWAGNHSGGSRIYTILQNFHSAGAAQHILWSGTGDASIRCLTTATDWTFGSDNSADTFAISSGDTLGINNALSFVQSTLDATFGGHVNFTNAKNLILGTATGSKIATAANQKLSLWGVDPVVQPSNIAAPSGGAVQDAEARIFIDSLRTLLTSIGAMASS